MIPWSVKVNAHFQGTPERQRGSMIKRIAITQRVEEVVAYAERRDCLDQRWAAFFRAAGLLPVPIPNTLSDPSSWLAELAIDGVVLSGGNDLATLPDAAQAAPERDALEDLVIDFASSKDLPLLGVCRGLQVLASKAGAGLHKIEGHVAAEHTLDINPGSPFTFPATVNSYHSYTVYTEDLPDSLETLATVAGRAVEAMRHTRLNQVAIMWHPEREADFNREDIELFKQVFSGVE